MRAPGSDDPLGPFEDRIREWGLRPPWTPVAVARTQVMARLPEVSRPAPWFRLLAAAALVVVLVTAVWRGSPHPAGEQTDRAALRAAPLGPNVVVWVVDARTTVYFVLSREGSAKGGVS